MLHFFGDVFRDKNSVERKVRLAAAKAAGRILRSANCAEVRELEKIAAARSDWRVAMAADVALKRISVGSVDADEKLFVTKNDD